MHWWSGGLVTILTPRGEGNIAPPPIEEVDLLTESIIPILTESGLNILVTVVANNPLITEVDDNILTENEQEILV